MSRASITTGSQSADGSERAMYLLIRTRRGNDTTQVSMSKYLEQARKYDYWQEANSLTTRR
ncbi:hypothetical protein KIN20_009211 [Parelaphostrongylus tenuis]|uniref:Uncharacterized protein n=1 Tax=Parelaphostrongylus tenuis TaxID=148309 RepID=A0AAD5MXJ5_PARTN|nr:hypothetical protein KIN20_009211 [Parelaphostrongylus tenuis]